MKKYYFFDLDGTLTDPALGITNSFKHAYRHFGMEIPSYEKLCTFIGPPLVTTFKKELNFDDEKTKEGVKAYREYFSTTGIFENQVYDG
ncbi:MAG: HAD hydrolase-like protein, partial [Spirochaetaceae bacterium]|nr:HAD hydrolase-like protein [Spirochaetaceae bacterium]